MTKTVILDRDGVINFDSPNYIKSPDEFKLIPGSLEAIAKLKQAGFTVVVATNQSGVGRGFYTLETLEAIHQKLHNELAKLNTSIDKIYFCPHEPHENCDCRKPKPGLIEQVENDYQIDLSKTFLVGDSWRDILAGKSMNCRCILVKTGNGENAWLHHQHEMDNIHVSKNLSDAVDWILKQ